MLHNCVRASESMRRPSPLSCPLPKRESEACVEVTTYYASLEYSLFYGRTPSLPYICYVQIWKVSKSGLGWVLDVQNPILIWIRMEKSSNSKVIKSSLNVITHAIRDVTGHGWRCDFEILRVVVARMACCYDSVQRAYSAQNCCSLLQTNKCWWTISSWPWCVLLLVAPLWMSMVLLKRQT